VGCLWLVACSPETPQEAAPSKPPSAAQITTGEVMEKWSRSCVLCHVAGEGGAPRLGHSEEWEARLAQGEDMMLEHVVEGYNNMPPLGYCMDCEADDFRALTRYMAGL
jgi:cytochrome c5